MQAPPRPAAQRREFENAIPPFAGRGVLNIVISPDLDGAQHGLADGPREFHESNGALTGFMFIYKCWLEGFRAGQAFDKKCPYAGNMLETISWRNGWLEGAEECLSSLQQEREKRACGVDPAADAVNR